MIEQAWLMILNFQRGMWSYHCPCDYLDMFIGDNKKVLTINLKSNWFGMSVGFAQITDLNIKNLLKT